MPAKEKKIHIGTSGWNYKHWRGVFYPEDLSQKEWLDFYQSRFQSVEINNSFYQLPAKSTFRQWKKTVRENFIFAVKASRYITHMKKLKDSTEPVQQFLEHASILDKTLGPVLFQLPPHWHLNRDRFSRFLDFLPRQYRYTVEFRDDSWWKEEIYQLLSEYNVAFCIYQLAGTLSPREVTADFVYVRLHGPAREAYQGQYDVQDLAGWAGAFTDWARQGKEIFCFFDNDQNGYAALDALKLQEMVS